MPDERMRRSAAMRGQLQAAALMVHHITGRTDQDVGDICRLYPDHDAVVNYLKVLQQVPNEHLTPRQKEMKL